MDIRSILRSNKIMKKSLNVIGCMSGTSLDGVDLTLNRIRLHKPVVLLDQFSFPFPRELRERLQLAVKHKLSIPEVALLHHDLGRFYAKLFLRLPRHVQKQTDLIGLHGQTIFHEAPQATWQIGEPAYLSVVAKVPIVSDFRTADLAVGGQGAPIATLFHQNIFAHKLAKKERIAVNNIGGISNLTLISRKGVELSFDTGPGNMLVDLWLQRRSSKKFDKDGNIARSGRPSGEMIKSFLKHRYFQRKPPKSCGREEFGETFFGKMPRAFGRLSLKDQVATLTHFTAKSIAGAYDKLPHAPQKIYFCGGGARNGFLLELIQNDLPAIEVTTTDEKAWDVFAVEASAIALLAAYRYWNLVSNVSKTTGAKASVSLGKIN